MQHPKTAADLGDDLFGLRGGKEGALQQESQRIAGNILLQNQAVLPLLNRFKHGGQVGTAVGEQLLINLTVSGKLPQDKKLSGGFVPNEADGAPGAFFHQTDGLIFFLQNLKQPSVNDNPSKS